MYGYELDLYLYKVVFKLKQFTIKTKENLKYPHVFTFIIIIQKNNIFSICSTLNNRLFKILDTQTYKNCKFLDSKKMLKLIDRFHCKNFIYIC